MNENSNIPLYAQNIVDRCEFIHESQLPQVTDRLYALQAHLIEHGRRADSAKALEREARRKRREDRRRAQLAAQKDVRAVAWSWASVGCHLLTLLMHALP